MFHKKTRKHANNKNSNNHHSPTQIEDNRAYYNKNESKGPPIPMEKWVDDPLLLCVHPNCDSYHHTNYDKQIAIPINTVFQFESKIFKGVALVRSTDMPNANKEYFKGRSRKMDFTIQGHFKRKIRFDRLYTGQIFTKPFTKVPGQFVISAAMKLLKTLAPALEADIDCDQPYMLSPYASATQVFQVSLPGNERKLPKEPKEDLTLIDSKFKNMKFSDRKSFFHSSENLQKYHFEPKYVYTLSCYSHMIAASSYSLHALGMKWGIHHYIPSPMQLCAVILPPNEADERNKYENSNRNSSVSNTTTTDSSNSNSHISVLKFETILSEELQSESKEDDEDHHFAGDLTDLAKCEYLVNFQLWHTSLVKELFGITKKKGNNGGWKLF